MTLYCYFYVVYNSVRYPKEVLKAYWEKIYLILIHYPRKVSLETLRTKKKYELISRVAAGRIPQNCFFEETQSVCACVVGICIFLCRPVLRGFAVIFWIIILQYENYLKIWYKTQIIFCETWRTTEKYWQYRWLTMGLTTTPEKMG